VDGYIPIIEGAQPGVRLLDCVGGGGGDDGGRMTEGARM